MNKKAINRRDFLKVTASVLAGLATLPFQGFLRNTTKPNKKTDHRFTREAMYYTRANNLAG